VHGTVRKFVEMFVDEVVGPLEAEIDKRRSHRNRRTVTSN
jgi:hypothetical protein